MPSWVADHDKWEEAKKAVDKNKKTADDYYAEVTAIYKKMGGKVKHKNVEIKKADGSFIDKTFQVMK